MELLGLLEFFLNFLVESVTDLYSKNTSEFHKNVYILTYNHYISVN